AGYFPTPAHLLPRLASLMTFSLPQSRSPHVLVDPCAGDGEAIIGLRNLWFGEERSSQRYNVHDAHLFLVELEKDRFKAAEAKLSHFSSCGGRWDTVLEADAFHVDIKPNDGASLLFLNPPYDTDAVEGRLEHRFLKRWTGCLMPGAGLLMFVAPHYALKASATFLACQFSDLRAWRFPDDDFAPFRQCVLVARRRTAALPENGLDRKRIERWSEAPEVLPVLEELGAPAYGVRGEHPGLTLETIPLDVQGLVDGFRPWANSPMFGTHRSVGELIGARYEVAMPPRPAHIALALSAGMLNGKRLAPNRPGLPPLLVKGSFRRDFRVVEEKFDKDGIRTGSVQVQRPKLTLHALRLDTLQFLELQPGTVPSGAQELSGFNTADLVEAYGESLGRLMRSQFPALHDPSNPEHAMDLPELGRRPFTIQRHLISAGLKLLARGENPMAAAEVGTGKSTVSLSIAGYLAPEHFSRTTSELRRLGFDPSGLQPVRRILILCPPHLLKSWRDQAAAVLPGHRVQTVETVSDLDRPAEIYLLSRETAKLSHGLRGLERRTRGARQCPRCGRLVTADPEALANRRERCGHQRRLSTNRAAALAKELAAILVTTYPSDPTVRALVADRNMLKRWLAAADDEGGEELTQGPTPASAQILAIARGALRLLGSHGGEYLYEGHRLRRAIELLTRVAGAPGIAAPAIQICDEARRTADRFAEEAAAASARGLSGYSLEVSGPRSIAAELIALVRQIEGADPEEDEPRNPLLAALESLVACGRWEDSEPCQEPLFQAVPEPRRFSIARYLLRHRRRLACNPDLLILDEAHEYSNLGSAQQKAAHRLVEIPGVPTLALSGSLMGGYAGSLFANFWAMSPRFRKAFRRTEKGPFVTRYGYRKVFVPAGLEGESEIVGYGVRSDREEQREPLEIRQMGEAPGVLPLFILEHLLPVALIMHKEDLEGELPPCRELQVPIEIAEDDRLGQEMLAEQQRLAGCLMQKIRADLYSSNAGKLWGAMSLLPSYLDRATDDLTPFVLKYPEEVGGAVVAEGKLFPASELTPKERWLLARVRGYLDEGRNVLIFLLHTGKSGLPKRYLRLFKEHLGELPVFLDVNKVKAAQREDWLNAQVIEPGRRILITNPKAVQTGLNNLVAFSRAIWVEGVDYDARVVRQANGRVHRIGQTLDVTIEVPYYAGTMQKLAVDLVARKITASVQVDGLSIEGALESAGAGTGSDEANQVALGIGQAIYEAWLGAS
ncbi:MAG TPA: DUF6094 domain-containing protein, partial [Thermoanaerobaculia bacterium]